MVKTTEIFRPSLQSCKQKNWIRSAPLAEVSVHAIIHTGGTQLGGAVSVAPC